jgi:hypothetical protein
LICVVLLICCLIPSPCPCRSMCLYPGDKFLKPKAKQSFHRCRDTLYYYSQDQKYEHSDHYDKLLLFLQYYDKLLLFLQFGKNSSGFAYHDLQDLRQRRLQSRQRPFLSADNFDSLSIYHGLAEVSVSDCK